MRHKTKEDPQMLGRLLVMTVGGVLAWKYRDSIREYVKGNVGPDTRLGSARERVRSGAWREAPSGRPTE
jgi:hypothetical protein